MIVNTTDEIKEHKITEVMGLVRGNTVRAKNVGRDIMAGFRNLHAQFTIGCISYAEVYIFEKIKRNYTRLLQ